MQCLMGKSVHLFIHHYLGRKHFSCKDYQRVTPPNFSVATPNGIFVNTEQNFFFCLDSYEFGAVAIERMVSNWVSVVVKF